MCSDAQIHANRLNAQKSTGPRTATGKAVVAQNAVKHGLLARQAVIAGEDPGEYEFYRDQMLTELAPEGAMESMLAHRAVGLAWRLQRAERLQNDAFEALYAKDTTGPLARITQSLLPKTQPGPGESSRDLTLGHVVVKDFANARVLDRLLMYERRLEHSLYKTVAELQRLRLLRQLDQTEEEPERDGGPTPLDRAKQTQFASAQMEAKCLAGKDVCENSASAPASKQTRTNPIPTARHAGRSQSFCPDRTGEVGPDSSQATKAAVYSVPTRAGCDLEHAAGTVMVLRQCRKESS